MNFSKVKYYNYNRVIIKHYMNYYMKCWANQNKIAYNKEIQRSRIIQQYKIEYNQAIESEFTCVRQFALNKKLNIENSNTEKI